MPLGCGMPKSCYEQALAFLLEHRDAAGILLVHGYITEPEGPEGLPFSHAWAELRTGVVYDPSSGLLLERDGPDGWYAVLRAAALAAYTPGEALANLAECGRAQQWPATLRVRARLVDDWIGRLRRQVPGLVEWFERMTDADPAFRAQLDQLAEQDDLLVVHALDHLARHPSRWQGHSPGAPWPHSLHPFGQLQ